MGISHDKRYPHSDTVVLRRVDANANQRSFMEHYTSVCMLPEPFRGAEVSVNEPTGNCFCEIPPPPVLPDAADASASCILELDEYVTYNHPEFYSVSRLKQRFEEAKNSRQSSL